MIVFFMYWLHIILNDLFLTGQVIDIMVTYRENYVTSGQYIVLNQSSLFK